MKKYILFPLSVIAIVLLSNACSEEFLDRQPLDKRIREHVTLYFYENPDACRVMGESARRRVQAGYSWSDYGDKMIAAYRKILNLDDEMKFKNRDAN